ncbi:MAG: hypothetical protein ABJC36_12715 [Gemmatimonadales bacterium]
MSAVSTISTEQLEQRLQQGGAFQELGYTNVRTYEGGQAEWKESGRPVVRLVTSNAA